MTPEEEALEEARKKLQEAYLEQEGFMRDSTGKLKRKTDERVEIEKKLNEEIKKNFKEEEIIFHKQQDLYKQTLASMGYKLEADRSIIKTTIELNQEQRKVILEKQREIDKLRKLQATIDQIAVAPGEKLNELAGKFSSSGAVWDQLKNNIHQTAGASKGLAIGLFAATSVAGGLAKAISSYTSAVYQGQRGTAVAAKSTKEFADQVSDAALGIGALLTLLPGAGLAIKAIRIAGAAIAGLGVAAKFSTARMVESAEQNDKLFNTFQKLSDAGLASVDGITGTYGMLQSLRMTTAEIEKFEQLLGSNAKELKLFGATTLEGANKFVEVAGELRGSEIGQKLELLGVSADAQREHALKYMALQTRIGGIQEKNTRDIVKSTAVYIEELDKLAALTGASRKEQEEARAAIMAIEELRAALILARKDTSEAGKARTSQLETTITVTSALQAMGYTQQAGGLAKLVAARGPVDDLSAAAYQTFPEAFRAIQEGEGSTEVMTKIGRGARRMSEQAAGPKSVGADLSGFLSGTIDQLDDLATIMSEAEKESAKTGKSVDKLLNEIIARKKDKPDKRTEDSVNLARQQQQYAATMDSVLFHQFNATEALKASAETLHKAAAELAKLGGKPPPGMYTGSATANVAAANATAGIENTLQQTGLGRYAPSASPEFDAPSASPEFTTAPSGSSGSAAPAPSTTPGDARLPAGEQTGSQAPAQSTSQAVPSSVSVSLVNLLKGLEGFSPKAFWDYKQYSIGYGTKASGPNETITEAEAATRLEAEINKSSGIVSTFGNKNKYKWGQNQVDALSSFIYNGGPGFLTQVTSDGKRNNLEILNSIPLYNRAGGKVSSGLERRRRIESELFSKELQARYGGLFNGPNSGYPVMLHGNEVVVPISALKDTDFNTSTSSVSKTELSNVFSSNQTDETKEAIRELIGVMSDKLDTVISKLTEGVDKQETLIKYTMI